MNAIDSRKLVLRTKRWIEYDGKPLLGIGRCSLLEHIEGHQSLQKAADAVGICKKTAYNYIRSMERRLGEKIIVTQKGGSAGGATVQLTDTGRRLVQAFREK